MRRNGGYSSYRGRMTFQGFLKGLIVVLAVILVAALAGYFILQRYIIYTDSGTRIDLPFFNRAEEPEPTEDVNIVFGGGEENPVPAPEDTQSAGETEGMTELRAVWLPLTALTDGTAQAQAEAAGGNAVVLDMKLTDGTLAYHSEQPLANQAGVNMADEDGSRERAIRELNEGELYTIARVSCFKDHGLSAADRPLNILTNSGYLWMDPEGVRWTSPANEQVRAYLTGIAVELAQLGFDEILLDFAGYPTQGELGWIKRGEAYSPGQLDQVVGRFYEQVAMALEPYEVKMSIRTTEGALTGTDTLSGQTAADLAARADRVWVEAETLTREDCQDLLSAAGATEGMLVLLTGRLEPGAGDQAVLSD